MKTKVKELRMAFGLTQAQLAAKVHVSSRTIISLEQEQYNPSLMLAYRYLRRFCPVCPERTDSVLGGCRQPYWRTAGRKPVCYQCGTG